MGDLIVMTRPTALPRRDPPAGESAAILFFTGVRYYRMEDVMVPEEATVRRRRSAKVDKRSLPCSVETHA